MEYIEGRKLSRSEILAIWGVPPLVAGIGDDSKYDNAQEQLRMFLEFNIAPRLTKHALQVTHGYLSKFPRAEGLFAVYDTSQVAAFIEIELQRAERISQLKDLTINERRALMKKKPLPGGDAIYDSLSLVPIAGEGIETTSPNVQKAFSRRRRRN